MKSISSKTIVFVTGNFVSNLGWNPWKSYFEAQGYTTYAPAWPHKEGRPADLRKKHPHHDKELAHLGFTEVLDFYSDFIKKLPEKPIIIGHSMGGLLTQHLLQRDLGAAGIVIHSVPPQGVLSTRFSFYKATWGPLGFFTSSDNTFLMSLEQWKYAFTNGMSPEAQQQSYEENVIPESKRISRDGLTSAAAIDFNRKKAPLLFLAGTYDNIMPASLNYSNYKRYAKNPTITEFKEFPRNHYVLGQDGWEENAAYILNWIKE